MTASPDVYLPPDVAAVLDELGSALRAAAGDNLLGLILYGGLVRGRYNPETSDINVVVLLSHVSAAAIERIAPALQTAWRAKRVEPLIITPNEIPRLALAFPTKLLDIQRRHVALIGDDPFGGIDASRDHIRLRVEQELRNLSLRLRRRFVAIHDDPAALAAAVDEAATTLAVNLRALLFLERIVSDERQPALAVYDRAAQTFGLDAGALEAAKHVHRDALDKTISTEMFGRLLATIDKAANIAAAMEAP
jgi:hypothetical protein